jgi:hypothetical protein
MVSNDKRYADLPHSVRAFLEMLDDEKVNNLHSMADVYDRLSMAKDGKVSPLDFLLQAKPRTLEWLKDARKEEIDQLDEAIKLVRSGRTVGRFMKWVFITTIGAFIVMSQLGDALTRLWNLGKGALK